LRKLQIYFCKMKQVVDINQDLIKKYNRPVPRYTSYPTVPCWNEEIDVKTWEQTFSNRFSIENHTKGISLYVHLPFCESLCTYCGCNKRITTNHKVEEEYLAAIEKEWKLYRKLMQQTPVIREIHLGGGTPTFFSPQNLKRLIDILTKNSIIHPSREFSIEGHPNNTTKEHLTLLYSLGFRRISYGVQDNDPEVQRLINRHQPFENVKSATEQAREVGFTSVNFDLIYGLPAQTVESIERTINQVITLRPDRIAFYSYAHTPWTNKGQRLFDETNLPSAEEKMALYLKGKELLTNESYVDIGMDHFSLPTDDLYKAWKNGKLHRNFMGYSTQNSGLLVGLGVSAISDIGNAFAQNNKSLHEYYVAINANKLAIKKGYFLSEEDMLFRKNILDLSCKGSTVFAPRQLPVLQEYTFPELALLKADGFVEYDKNGLNVTTLGHHFIRNICSAFDLYIQRNNSSFDNPLFSKAI
jgi:oxygen-independent coproporphyrinogen III oxidase